jgi:four helix bundle protein
MRFEDLEVWQESRKLVAEVYEMGKSAAISKDFGLNSQIQRAAVSIMTNIAEGFERLHLKEKLQFYNIARASAGEVRSLLYIVEDNYAECAPSAQLLRPKVIKIGKQLSGLINATKARQ